MYCVGALVDEAGMKFLRQTGTLRMQQFQSSTVSEHH